jgi:outer membrane receptor protein involved in Fe transport
VRVDGSSTFGDDFGLAPYPKVSASYLISDHTFWPDWWEDLKLRAAYGESGRLPGPFDAVRTFDSVPGDNGQPGLSPGNPGNPDLGPERSREIELGFEGSALNNRITGSFTWYRQRTNDAIINVQPAPSQGFPESAPQNVGTLGASGVELDLNVTVFDRGNLAWEVGGNFSTSNTEAIDLGGREIEFAWDQGVREGSSVPSFFGNVLENPNQIPDDPSNIQYKSELQNLGPTFPPRELAIRTSVTLWDDLTLEVLGQGQYGHVLSAGTARENAERGIWPGCQAIVRQINEGDRSGLTARQLGRCDPQQIRDGQWVFPADFFRLRSASIQYRVPNRLLPEQMQNLVVQLQGRNLLTFTDYPGLDPEAYEDGSNDAPYRQEYYNLPPTKSFTVSLSTSF